MRIAIVCPYAWDRPGGVQAHVRGLAGALRTKRHEVVVIAPRSWSGCSDPDEDVTHVGRSVPIPANGSIATLSFGPLVAARLRRALDELAPDVIHVHEPLIPSLSLLALWSSRAPKVGTFHASAESSAGYRLAGGALRRAAARLDVRTAVSDAARALVARYFPGDYVLTPNGIDAARFADGPVADLGEGKVVLFLGRLERRKGLEVLIQAMTRLRGKASLVVAGDGPERSRCETLAQDLLVDATFLGRVDDESKAALYRRADVYCAPGLGGESFGIVLLEAMAAGTPVVCSDLPGFRAVGGVAAAFARAGDAGSFADALQEVLFDEASRIRMTKMGLQVARSFDWSRLVDGVIAQYRLALESRPVTS